MNLYPDKPLTWWLSIKNTILLCYWPTESYYSSNAKCHYSMFPFCLILEKESPPTCDYKIVNLSLRTYSVFEDSCFASPLLWLGGVGLHCGRSWIILLAGIIEWAVKMNNDSSNTLPLRDKWRERKNVQDWKHTEAGCVLMPALVCIFEATDSECKRGRVYSNVLSVFSLFWTLQRHN